MVWWDVEDHSIQPVLQKEKETLRQSILTAQRMVKDAGYGFGVYTGLWWYHAVLNTENLDCPFWIARYPSRKAMAFGTAPDPKYRPEIHHQLWGWQYSSAGQVPGIHHSTDLDVIYTRSESAPQYREPTENLRLGSRGDGVRWVQQRLNAHGASLQVDGIFGKQTDAAVRAFQKSHDLDADGIVGPKTRAKLGM
jgi:GH25 family lysozyme M1 (1,4-beta-N-acetylmuramidase)